MDNQQFLDAMLRVGQMSVEHKELLAIVSELAGMTPLLNDGFGWLCRECDEYAPEGWDPEDYENHDHAFPHDSDCLWLRAQPFKKLDEGDEE